MISQFKGKLVGSGLVATCIVEADSSKALSLNDATVKPLLPDGEYDLEANGVHMRAVRKNGVWIGSDY